MAALGLLCLNAFDNFIVPETFHGERLGQTVGFLCLGPALCHWNPVSLAQVETGVCSERESGAAACICSEKAVDRITLMHQEQLQEPSRVISFHSAPLGPERETEV